MCVWIQISICTTGFVIEGQRQKPMIQTHFTNYFDFHNLTISQLDGTLWLCMFCVCINFLFLFRYVCVYFGSHQLHHYTVAAAAAADHTVRCSMSWNDLSSLSSTAAIGRERKTKSYKCNMYLPTDLCHAFSKIFSLHIFFGRQR